MVTVNCANCGKRLDITSATAYAKLKTHKEECPGAVPKIECPMCHEPVELKPGRGMMKAIFKHLKTCKNAKQ